MKNLFEAARVEEVKQRIAQLRPDSERQWGTMNPAQALEHCSRGVEMALGDKTPPRVFVGRIPGMDREAEGDGERRTASPEFADSEDTCRAG